MAMGGRDEVLPVVASRKQIKRSTVAPKSKAERPRRRSVEPETLQIDGVQFLSPDEWYAMFDEEVRRRLDMSGAEFIRKWKAKEFEDPDTPGVIETYMLMPADEQQQRTAGRKGTRAT